MNKKTLSGIAILAIVIGIMIFRNWAGSYDKYVMRDGCIYHKTKELAGDEFDISYTKVTCDESEFYKFKIESE